jgi:Arc/MetJ-type ribon-helix-helix transcriptional regulator
MARKPRGVFVSALPLSSLPQLEQLLVPFLGDKGSRGHVVMVRLGDDSVARLDDLVESGLFGSRSEAAAFLIGAGVQAQHELFERIAMQTAEIKRLRTALRETALAALGAGGPRPRVADAAPSRERAEDGQEAAPSRRPRRRRRSAAAAAPVPPAGKEAPE